MTGFPLCFGLLSQKFITILAPVPRASGYSERDFYYHGKIEKSFWGCVRVGDLFFKKRSAKAF